MSDRIFGHGYDIKKEYTIGLATSPTSFSSLQQNSNPVISQAAVGLPNGDHNMMDESPSQPHSNEQRQMFSYGNPSPFLGSPQPNLHSPSQPSADQISDVLRSVNMEDNLVDDLLMIPSFMDPEETQPPAENVTCDLESPYINQWDKISRLMQSGSDVVKQQIDRIWLISRDTEFDFSIRKRMTQVLEYMRWDKVNSHEKLTSHLYGQVQEQLARPNTAQDNDFRISLLKFSDRLANPYYQSAIALHIKEVLDAEKTVIDHSEMQQNAPLVRIQQLSSSLEDIRKCCYDAEHSVQGMLSEVQELQLLCQGQLHFIDMITVDNFNESQKACLRNAIARRNGVTENVSTTLGKLWKIRDLIAEVMIKVLDEEVRQYHRNQAYINNGQLPQHSCSINQLQEWCKNLASLISSSMQNLEKLLQYVARPLGFEMAHHSNGQHSQALQWMSQLKMTFQRMIEELVRKGLVVDKNPPQVLMKDKRFQCTLRHLVGDALDIHQMNFRVTAHLLNADQAIHVLNGGPDTEIKESGKIMNHQASSDYLNHGGGIISINMRNMCLKMQQRGGQRTQEMVAEHKFAMLFRANIDVHHNPAQPTTIMAQTMSLPIVVISHGKQEADAQATIFWDNAFAKLNRKPFEVETSVPWTDLLDALDKRWKKACDEGQSGRVVGLTEASRQFLTNKMFGQREVPPGTLISWQKFNHDKTQFTFWTWFFKVMELCSSSYVRKYWNMGYIHGFISKQDCEYMLKRTAHTGVFSFRFSESKLGGISISCNGFENGTRVVYNYEPDTLKNFETVSLPDEVEHLQKLVYLYPDIPKDEAFRMYYTPKPEKQKDDPYIKKGIKVTADDDPTPGET